MAITETAARWAAVLNAVEHTPTFHGEGVRGTVRKAVKPCREVVYANS